MTVFVTSDPHFNHANIMKFCPETRPYASVKDMNDHLIESWNSVVTNADTVITLGDFAFKSTNFELKYFFDALKGKKKLIRGNHDHTPVRSLPWQSVEFGDLFNFNGVKWHLNHHPFAAGQWDSAHHGSFHLFGHVHGKPVYDVPVRALDCGVDSIGPVPLSLEQIYERLITVPVVVKHHD